MRNANLAAPTLALALAIPALCLATSASAQDYHTDIRPVIVENCMRCHTEEGVGWSMEDPEVTYDRRRLIAHMVTSREMPPWLADSHVREYVDDLSLDEDVVAVFAAWRDAGFPRGEPRLDPDIRPEPVGTLEADLSLDLLPDGSYTPDPSMDNDYRCFIVDWPREEPGYVTGFRMEPGNLSIAHHAIVDVVEPEMVERFREFEEQEEGPGYQCFSGPAVPERLVEEVDERAAYEERYPGGFQDLVDRSWRLATWAPGVWGGAFPEGTGLRVEPGSALAVQMHYYTAEAPPGEADAGTRIYLQVADGVERRAFVFPQTRDDWLYGEATRSMVIQPGEWATYEVTHDFERLAPFIDAAEVTGVEEERIAAFEVHSAFLHMHEFGRSGEVTLVRPDGRAEPLLSVPRWDFRWQREFTFTEPKVVPRAEMAETSLRLRCTYHNSTEEPVYGGFASMDEMCVNFSYIAVREGPPETEATDPGH
jgi:hypothetical protein